jgi:hypothetical protein
MPARHYGEWAVCPGCLFRSEPRGRLFSGLHSAFQLRWWCARELWWCCWLTFGKFLGSSVSLHID